MQFRSRKSFGPRISLTVNQIAKVTEIAEAAGLLVDVENCATGSCYVVIFGKEIQSNIRGELYEDRGKEIAKIRLSGHDEGRRQDSTHCVVGSKSECLAALWQWLGEVIVEHGRAL